jgi:hypothetical protein
MGFLDKAKAAAGQAAVKAKAGVDDLQAKVELGSAYDELGKATCELIESGEVAHEKLEAPAAKIRELRQRLDDDARDAEPPPAEGEAEPIEAAPEPTPDAPAP